MSNRKWKSMNEPEFEEMLRHNVSEFPPEDIVTDVTPWKKEMNRVLIGMALSTISLNFFGLNYVLPAIGMVFSILGFRTLRRENKWLNKCFIITVIRTAYFFPLLILNTTIIQTTAYASQFMTLLSGLNLILQFILFFCFWQGLRTVQLKVNLPPRAQSAVALMIWYVLLCLLGLIQYNGLIIGVAMIIGYIFIIRSLWKLSRELDEAGYVVQTAPIKTTDRSIVIVILAVLIIGCTCGYVFGNSYHMNWNTTDTTEQSNIKKIKTHLIELGFPEYVLNDLTVEDIAACDGALQVVVDVGDHPVNNGRKVTTKEPGEPGSNINWHYKTTTVYDVKELRITGVGVQLPNENEKWMIFQHFLWTENPGFYGTECIQLWPAYRHNKGWDNAGDVTGRVLYDKDGTTFVSPYNSLGTKISKSNSIFRSEQTSTDIYATFSMPRNAENHRGYVAYPIIEIQDGYIADCWFNYTHQQSWLQYPALTAIEMRMANSWNEAGVFKTVQDALQFYSSDERAELISAQ